MKKTVLTVVACLFAPQLDAIERLECGAPLPQARTVIKEAVTFAERQDFDSLAGLLSARWSSDEEHADNLELALLELGQMMTRHDGLTLVGECSTALDSQSLYFENGLSGAIDEVRLSVDGGVITRAAVRYAKYRSRLPADDLSQSERAQTLLRFLRELEDHGGFSGAVSILEDGKPIFEETVGWADREREIPVDDRSLFNVASLNKIFTAVAVLQLVESGRLELTTEVGTILPDLSPDRSVLSIEIRHLLSHTSGISGDRSRTLFSPGTGYTYSNTGYGVLGDVIESVSALDYDDYLRLEVLGPLEMANTASFEAHGRPVDGLTVGYEPIVDDDGFRIEGNPFLQYFPGGPVGGYYSTVGDLARFARGLVKGEVLSPASVELMRTPKTELGAPDYGFGVLLWRGPGIWGHGGDLPGADADLEFFGDSGRVAIVLSNQTGSNPPVLSLIRALYFPESVQLLPESVRIEPNDHD